ncbi:MAG: T9SS type A sorting domain-containing protein [Bacteroidota bacterium]
MEGTASNPTAFIGIQPPAVTNPTLDHIGFGNPYGQFQGLAESETSVINKMRELGTHSIRFHVPWRDVVGPLTYNSSLNPNNLTETEINNLANDNSKWASTDAIIDHALMNKMDVVLQLAQGHTYRHEHVIPAIQGLTIAPDSSRTGSSVDSVFYVNENFYLYHLKLFANAAVRRYANKVGIWTIEGELNAAKLNHLAQEWRFGNKWADESPGGFQDKVWGILRDAVRQRDPSAKLLTVFHMLNLMRGLERFGPDIDIVGVNAYPNIKFATPVLGMAVGELVWATRRALVGLGMGSKEVYVTETNYPGIQASDPPSGISLNENLKYFSYNRQKQFMAEAIESATNYGAKGFFWWMFVAKDVSDDNIDSETGFGGIVKPNFQFKQPASTEFNQKLLTKHPGKANVVLTNKNTGGGDLGGKISLYGQRDSVISGGTVYALRGRSHTSKALQQSLGGLKHLRWENDATQFRLQQSFDILLTDNTRDRYALFAPTSPVQSIVKVGGVSISSYVALNDPWFVDANGNQPGNLNVVFQTGTNLNVFLGQSSAQGNKTYKILTNNQTDFNRVTFVFQNWTSINSTVSQPNSLESEVVFNASGASVTANYVVLKPLPPANVSMVATAGQNVKFTWTEHPDPNVTQYHIWRYKKWESPMWVGTRNRGTTNWTDASLKVASGSGGELYFYDVKAYYAPNASLSDDNWYQVNGDGHGILVERPEDQAFELERIPETLDVSNYPNPFNPSTRISYQLPEVAHVVLELYDITGRRIAELLNSEMPPGYHSVTWDGTGKASGVYLYRFTAQVEGKQDVFLRTGKLILTK